MKLDMLKAPVGNADYEVDADAVAEAIVRRIPTVRNELQPAAQRVQRRHRGRAPKRPHSLRATIDRLRDAMAYQTVQSGVLNPKS